MSRICQVTGKRSSSGNTRSHSMRATRRKFIPNLFKRNLLNPLTGEVVRIKVSANGLKCLLKNPVKYWTKLAQ